MADRKAPTAGIFLADHERVVAYVGHKAFLGDSPWVRSTLGRPRKLVA